MAKWFYDWADVSDPHTQNYPDLGRYEQYRLKTKKAVREEWREYLATFDFPPERKPKIRVWRIAYEEVKV
jgi:hypothetical protein